MGKKRFPKQTGCFTHWQRQQAAGWRLPTTTAWEDGQEEAWNASNQKSSPPQGRKGMTSTGTERNDLLAAHCAHFNFCYLKTLQGVSEASSKAHSQCSCPVFCQWEESAAAIGSGPGSPALLQQPLLGRRHALSNPGYPKRR